MKKPRNLLALLVILIGIFYLTPLLVSQPIPTGFDAGAVRQPSGQTTSDILYYNGATWVRLPKGTAAQVLKMNAGATAPEWGAGGGGALSEYVKDVADGTGIDGTATGSGSTYTPVFDATELDALTWSDAANASNLWTFDVSGNNTSLNFGDGEITASATVKVTGNLNAGTTTGVGTFHAFGTSFPVGTFERRVANTSSGWTVNRFEATSSGNMTDTFGPAFVFSIQDTANVDNDIVFFAGLRDGADDSGLFQIRTKNAGTYNTSGFVIDAQNRIGLGTTNPLRDLHMTKSTNAAFIMMVENTNTGQNAHAGIKLANDLGNNDGSVMAFFPSTHNTAANVYYFRNYEGDIRMLAQATSALGFGVGTSAADAIDLVIASNSYVGIGQPTPTVLLHVGSAGTGDLLVEGTATLGGLTATNSPTDNYVLSYDAGTSGFTWVVQAGAAGGDAWSDPVDSDIIPDTDDTYDIGTSTVQFRDGNFDGTVEADVLTEAGNAVPNVTDNLSVFSATTSAELAGVISDETGTGLIVFNDSPTLETATTFHNISDSDVGSHDINFHREKTTGTDVANNLRLGAFYFRGWHTDDFDQAALIACEVDGTPGDNDMPGRLDFYTTLDGVNSSTLRMRIDNAGNIQMGNPGTNYVQVTVGGTMTFAGTGNIVVPNDSIALATQTTGAYVAGITDSGSSTFTIVGSGGETATVTLALNQDSVDDEHINWGSNTGQVSGVDIPMAYVSGASFTTVQHMQNVYHSAGWVSGGDISDDGDGTISVALGTGLIRAVNSEVAKMFFFDWAAESGANVALTDNDINWVYAEYNSGSPRIVATNTERTDFHTNVLLGIVQASGTFLHLNTVDKHTVGDHANGMIRRLKDTAAYARVSGAVITATGTLGFHISAGSFWQGLTEFTTTLFDAGSDTFSYWHRASPTGFTETGAQTAISATLYDDGDGTLGTLSNNKYGVHWVYQEVDSHVEVMYGQGDYTLAEAEDAQPPSSTPDSISTHGFLVGKIIIKKSDSAFTQIESAFQTTFTGSIATDHGGLAGLTDDDHTQYAKSAGDTYTGVHDFGGASTWEMPNAADPDVTAEGMLSWDTDEDVIRGFSSGNQVVMSQATKTIQFTIAQPDDLDEKGHMPIFSNESGKIFYLMGIKAWSDTNNADFGLYEHTSTDRAVTGAVHIATVTCSQPGTGMFFQNIGSSTLSLASGTINSTNMMAYAFTTTDVSWIKVTLIGYYGADD